MSNDSNTTDPRIEDGAKAWGKHMGGRYAPNEVEELSEEVAVILAAADAADPRKPRTITTVGDMAGLADRTVFRTAEGHVFEVQGGHLLGTESTTWWSPLASWLPVTVLDEPAAACTGADSCESPTHVHGCFAEVTR